MTAKLTEDNQYEDKDHPTLWLVSSNFQGFLSNFPDSSCPCEVWGVRLGLGQGRAVWAWEVRGAGES